ncbi:MAG TPA: cofactor-independent phosphoglycerate mutase, partial [Bacillota bacterium]|nr:cofactor-independent phosphoglycerate mutase [Bacillota bacterium]
VLPDHPTPIETRTHSREPVPFFLYSSAENANGVPSFTEATARQTGLYIPEGHHLLDLVIKKR